MAKKELTKLQKKRKTLLTERIIMTICKWVLLLTPIVAYVIYRREAYFTYKNGLSVSLGCVLSLLVVLLVVKGQAEIFKGIWKFAVIFVLCFLLKSIMDDAVYISGAVLIGYFLSMWFTEPINRRKKLLEAIDNAQIQAEAMSEVELSIKS